MSIDFGNGRENGLGSEVGAENETMTGDLNEAGEMECWICT